MKAEIPLEVVKMKFPEETKSKIIKMKIEGHIHTNISKIVEEEFSNIETITKTYLKPQEIGKNQKIKSRATYLENSHDEENKTVKDEEGNIINSAVRGYLARKVYYTEDQKQEEYSLKRNEN